MNDLATLCPCGHSAFLHRTIEQTTANIAAGKHYVGECTGRGPVNGWACHCQVDRQRVITAAPTSHPAPLPITTTLTAATEETP